MRRVSRACHDALQCVQPRAVLLAPLSSTGAPPSLTSSSRTHRADKLTLCARSQLWKSHKVLCHRDPNVFYLPPLRPDEIDTLREFQDVPLRQGERLVDAAAPDQYGADLRAAMNVRLEPLGLLER